MAKNSYNPYYDVNQIYNYKGQYDKAKNSGDSQLAQQIASYAQQNYNNLRSNGYEDVAKSLGDVGYSGAKKIRDKYAMQGKVAIRPYLYNSKLKTKYGMSDADIDKALSFNETTGEVYLGGINLGTPYSNVDGTTYWNSDDLDAGAEKYIQHSGKEIADNPVSNIPYTSVNDNAQFLFNRQIDDSNKLDSKYDELYDKAMYENPFETPTGQSIMKEYKLKGVQESDNAKAEGGASNSGNIDSYAAANALRQQAAMTSKGQQMAIAAQSEAINNVRGILGDITNKNKIEHDDFRATIGLQQKEESRLFDEQQTEKLNDHSINYDIAEMTGYNPAEWDIENNRYFTNGTLTNPDLDYGIIIEDIDKKLETETDPEERSKLLKQKSEASFARNYKTSPNNYGGKYSQHANPYDLSSYSRGRTQPAIQSEREYNINMGEIANNQTKIENEAYNDFLETQLKSKQEAMNILESYVKNGVPPTQPMLDAAGYSNYTPESFMQAYINNKASIAKANKAGTGGGTPKVTDKDKLSYSAKQGIYDYITGKNYTPEGLRARLSSYDWDKYDAQDLKDWLTTYYGKNREVMSVVKDLFGNQSSDQATYGWNAKNGFSASSYASGLADKINKLYESDSSEYGYSPIQKGSDGYYRVSGNTAMRVIDNVYNDQSLTDDQVRQVLSMFGISEQQISEYEKNKNYTK